MEIRPEAPFEIPFSRSLAQEPSTTPVIESCYELGDEFPLLDFFRRFLLQGSKIGFLIDMFKIFDTKLVLSRLWLLVLALELFS